MPAPVDADAIVLCGQPGFFGVVKIDFGIFDGQYWEGVNDVQGRLSDGTTILINDASGDFQFFEGFATSSATSAQRSAGRVSAGVLPVLKAV